MAFWNDPSALTPKQSHRWVISFGSIDSPAYQDSTKNNFLPYYVAKSVDLPSYELGVQQAKYLYSHTFNFPKRVIWKPITITFHDVIIEQNLSDHPKMIFQPVLKDKKIQDNFTSLFGDVDGNFIKQSTQIFFYRLFQDAGYINPNEYDPDDKLLRFRSYTFKKNMIASFIDKRANSNNLIQDSGGTSTQIGDQRKLNFEDAAKLGANKYSEQTTLNIHQLAPYDDGRTINQETWKLYNPIISDVKMDKMDYSNENILSITITVHYDWAALQPNSITPKYDKDLLSQPTINDKIGDQQTIDETMKRIEDMNKELQSLESEN